MPLFAHTKKKSSAAQKLKEKIEKVEAPAYTPWKPEVNQILAPAAGRVLPLSSSSNEIFASGKAGNGVILLPDSKIISAPVSGKVIMLFPTNSSLSIQDEQGREVLVHVGMGTSHMKKSPFTAFIAAGDEVVAGQPLLEVDWEEVKKAGLSAETAIVLPHKEAVEEVVEKSVNPGEVLFKIQPATIQGE